jgi:hypothetical protein
MSRTIGQAADEYEPSKIMNIKDLARVSIDAVIETKTYGEDADAFTIDVITVDEVDYRVPVSVLGLLQAMVGNEDIKPFKFFKVLRTGETMQDTKYSIVPLYD